ncbi:DUF4297 domain-containing protein [Edaphocola flava]|uniref:DUF4297 domain-containing protein n=1 Tax=Edaphocola flava TaxID=2499629 RepID=UPI00100AE569|nr:DUF4297 domain-containing protein [Edaphocola flava]
MSKSVINPLFDNQREKAGASTFDKYLYQYHWALFRIIKEHDNQKEYAVIVELHEDVVLSSSLDAEKAIFEFNQIKTNKASFTVGNLTKRKKVKSKQENSVLGKLISSSHGKVFSDKVLDINLVSVNEYSLKLKEDNVKLNSISLSDLHKDTLRDLTDAIKAELGIDPLPDKLKFVVSELSDKQFQDIVIAEIAKVINNLFPGSNCNAISIYTTLFDEITRKGVITEDFPTWEELIKNKALTSNTVTHVINQFTAVKDEVLIQAKFTEIATEMGLNTITRKNIERSFVRYRQSRLGNRSTLQIDTCKEIKSLIQRYEDDGVEKIEELLELVASKLSNIVTDQFSTNIDIKAAIICEFIMG